MSTLAHDAWRYWATSRQWSYYPVWETMRYAFRGGGLTIGAPRYLTHGWSGRFGGLPCLGFVAGPGDPARVGLLHVVAVRIPGVTFPELTIEPADFTSGVPALPIDPVFDLTWQVTTSSPAFARDVVGPVFQAYFASVLPDFHQIWFERDAILLSRRERIAPDEVDQFLGVVRTLADKIPTVVYERLKPQQAAVAHRPPLAYQPVPRPQPVAAVSADEWKVWAEQRRWVYTANARNLVERFHHAPVPVTPESQFTSGFAGRFGDLPCFGWKWVASAQGEERIRHVVCLRRPGMSLKPVRVTREDPLLAELVGSGDIEVGAKTFDDRWQVTSPNADFAQQLLGPALWRRFEAPDLPAFAQVWFERDVVAVISEGPIRPADVDGYLMFLHGILAEMDGAA